MINSIVQTNRIRKQVPGRESFRMDTYLRKYIDSLIREYISHTPDGCSLDISELTPHDRESLAHLLIESDPIAKERIEDRMHDLLQERLEWVDAEMREDRPKRLHPITNESCHY